MLTLNEIRLFLDYKFVIITILMSIIPFLGISINEIKKETENKTSKKLLITTYIIAFIFYVLLRILIVTVSQFMSHQISGFNNIGSMLFILLSDGLYWFMVKRISIRWHELETNKILIFYLIEYFFLGIFYSLYVYFLTNIIHI
jgi:hypothetical protein